MSQRKHKGPEKFLLKELNELAHGRPLPEHSDGLGPEYVYYNDPAGSVGSPGSNNWAMLALGCKYLVNEPGCREKVLDVCQANKERFGGRELDSSIYEPFTAGSLWIIQKEAKKRGDTEVYNAVADLNRYRAARYTLFYCDKAKHVLAVGQRSAGSKGSSGGDGWIDVVTKMGLGKYSQKELRRLLSRYKKASYIPMRFIPLVAAEIEASFRNINKSFAKDILKNDKRNSIIPVYYFEIENGFGIFHPKSIHGSTQPVIFGYCIDGDMTFVPDERGSKDRSRKKGLSKCAFTYQGNTLSITAKSEAYGETKDFEFIDIELFLEIGGSRGFRNLTESNLSEDTTDDDPEVVPGEENDEPEELSLWEKIKNWIENQKERINRVLD